MAALVQMFNLYLHIQPLAYNVCVGTISYILWYYKLKKLAHKSQMDPTNDSDLVHLALGMLFVLDPAHWTQNRCCPDPVGS